MASNARQLTAFGLVRFVTTLALFVIAGRLALIAILTDYLYVLRLELLGTRVSIYAYSLLWGSVFVLAGTSMVLQIGRWSGRRQEFFQFTNRALPAATSVWMFLAMTAAAVFEANHRLTDSAILFGSLAGMFLVLSIVTVTLVVKWSRNVAAQRRQPPSPAGD